MELQISTPSYSLHTLGEKEISQHKDKQIMTKDHF